jgi:hypothetical protein
MSFSHGNDAELKVQNAAGVLTDISTYLTSISMPREIEANETSTMRVRDRTYVPGLRNRTVSFEGRWDPTLDALLDGITGMVRTFEYSPAGAGVGLVTYAGSLILTSYEPSTPHDDVADWSAEGQVTGAVTRTVGA